MRGQNLNRYVSAKAHVNRSIYLSHSPGTEGDWIS